MTVLETERSILRRLDIDDAQFILTLLNEPSFLRYIGDKKVRNLDDARRYLLDGPLASYEKHGFGLYAVELKDSHAPIGMCGLLKRDELSDPDIGFAFLPDFWNKGFAFEAASSVLNYALKDLNLKRVLAIVNPDNESSIKLLQKLGFKFERIKGEVELYAFPHDSVE
jgi:[ribosomal protein S5]-alanine N-acetyltransferase